MLLLSIHDNSQLSTGRSFGARKSESRVSQVRRGVRVTAEAITTAERQRTERGPPTAEHWTEQNWKASHLGFFFS